MKEIRLATIGTGSIVHYILDAVTETEGIYLEAVYSRSESKGKKLAEEYKKAAPGYTGRICSDGIEEKADAPKVYTDLNKMLADEDINTIYVASPNSLHYEQVKMALNAGKNVICEKPFCPHADQVKELIRLAKDKKLFLADATPTAFLPNFYALKEQLPKIGRVRLVLCNYSQYSSRYDQLLRGEITNVFSTEFSGGSLYDINYYNVYFAAALFGKPEMAVYYPNTCFTGVDTSGIIIMKYPDFVFEGAGAKDTWGVNSAQIEGEKGYIYVENGSNGFTEIKVVTKNSEEKFNFHADKERRSFEVKEITECMLNNNYKELYDRLETTVSSIEIIEQARINMDNK